MVETTRPNRSSRYLGAKAGDFLPPVSREASGRAVGRIDSCHDRCALARWARQRP